MSGVLRILGSLGPTGWASLGVFLLILGAAWVVPPLLPQGANVQRPSLGASPPLATILRLTTDTGEERWIDEARAQRLWENGRRTLGKPSAPAFVLEPEIVWVEPSPVMGAPGDPETVPMWLTPGEFAAYAGSFPSYRTPATAYRTSVSDLTFPFGTDELGRDLLGRVLEGGRISIGVGFAATAVAVLIGMAYGGISGYAGGRTDAVMMRLVDALYALPFLIFVILLMVLFERSLLLVFIAIGAVEWLTTARIVRGEVLALKHLPFVEAARGLGQSPLRILFRQILPNTLPVVVVYATLTVPAVILLESILSFLGLGVQPPTSSWGVLISEGADRMDSYPWLLVFPAAFFFTTLLALNLLGDELREVLDPKRDRSKVLARRGRPRARPPFQPQTP